MSSANLLIILVIASFMLWRFLPVKGIRNITTTQLKDELTDQNIQFIDVRTPGEFKRNAIRGFKNIPLNQLGVKAAQLTMDKEVVVICQSGMRSTRASKILKKLGFKKITNVKGGMNAWR